jgi:NAD-dependent deacetylase
MNIVVLSGAGMSAESGLKTFRDMGGLWESFKIEDVATPEAFRKDPDTVLRFYNERRKQAYVAEPNPGHKLLAELERAHSVKIITQNVDGLHEKAGSRTVLHLHGELSKVRSTGNPELIYEIGGDSIKSGQMAEDGFPLRPHIVWFGEEVPLMPLAEEWVAEAELFIVVGTSLQVYPAAGLLQYAHCPVWVIDPHKPNFNFRSNVQFISLSASLGLRHLAQVLDLM